MKGECADSMNENLMNHPYSCGNKSLLIDYLYGECDTTTNEAIKAHLSVCTACAEELDSLRAVRGSLEAWIPPEPTLGFKIVQEGSKGPKFWARIWELGGWALPAAVSANKMAVTKSLTCGRRFGFDIVYVSYSRGRI